MRRPFAVMAATVVVLVALGLPFLRVSFGGVDARALPAASEARVATDAAAAEFPRLAGESISVVVQDADAVGAAQLDAFAAGLGALPGARGAAVTVPATTQTAGTALISVAFEGAAVDAPARQLVAQIRETAAPEGTRVLVGGRGAPCRTAWTACPSACPWPSATWSWPRSSCCSWPSDRSSCRSRRSS